MAHTGLDLPSLYFTGEYTDCILVSQEGEELKAHRIVLAQHERFKELVDGAGEPDRRVRLSEPTKVVLRMLQWMYGVDWAYIDGDTTMEGIGVKLMHVMGACRAAEKYEIPKLANDAYALVGKVIKELTSVEQSLRLLRDISSEASTMGALQRTIIDRSLDLLSRDDSRPATAQPSKKRTSESAETSTSTTLEHEDEAYPDIIVVPKRSGRPKKLSEKAKTSGPPRKKKEASPEAGSEVQVLHCVCRQPEDPYLVQCDHCERWFHPGCIGKGKYAKSTYKCFRRRSQESDEKQYREDNLSFSCMDCDARVSSEV